ncbi:MAG: OsmC family protein [Cyclobacteriaceae bacterium]|nr:OsmC family protein [Cyclobacteriaceae bacterium]
METNEIQTATAIIGTDVYKTELTARTHTIIADEPFEVGGKDRGPRPGDFVRMGLASCTAITLRMYANRKNMDVQQIRVSVSNGAFDGKTKYKTEIEITGNVSDEQKQRLMQIAKLCPVHKLLTNPIEINTSLLVVGS